MGLEEVLRLRVGDNLLWLAFGLPTGLLGRIGGKIMSGGRKRELVKQLMRLLDVRPGEYVLEVGFGPGVGISYAQQCVRQSGLVVGVDPSKVMLDMANHRNADAINRGTVKLLIGTVERLPFPDGYFDKAYAMNSMQLWPDVNTGLSEISRVLKYDGRILLSFDGPARKNITNEWVQARLNEVGFRQINTNESDSTLYVVAVK